MVDALRAITIDAATVLGMQDEVGSIRAGKIADFTVIDRDPIEEGEDALRDANVIATVFTCSGVLCDSLGLEGCVCLALPDPACGIRSTRCYANSPSNCSAISSGVTIGSNRASTLPSLPTQELSEIPADIRIAVRVGFL